MNIKDLEQVLESHFSLRKINSQMSEEHEYLKYLQKALAERIKYFIRSDLDKLLQILYRIDIPQSETDLAFNLGDINAVSLELAEKIIIRQLKKIDYARNFTD